MKKICILTFVLFGCLAAHAQQDSIPNSEKEPTIRVDTEDDDEGGVITIRYKKNKKEKEEGTAKEGSEAQAPDEASSDAPKSEVPTLSDEDKKTKPRKNITTRWLMLDYGISSYTQGGRLNLPAGYEPLEQKYWGSHNWTLHVVKQRVNLIDHKANLMYGIAFDFNRYNFQNDYTMQPNKSAVEFVESTADLTKNRLNATYLTVPLMLNFETNPRRKSQSFHFNAGVYGGLLLTGRLRQANRDDRKITVDDDFNLNKVRYGLRGEIGFGWVNIYLNYGLNSFFDEEEKGAYDLKPINFGITLIPF
jgi:opacity protein-like surface antigen